MKTHHKDDLYREYLTKVPEFNFPEVWRVSIVPPFAGAICRFIVREGESKVSVYLDADNSLGCWEGPYWEVYPYKSEYGDLDTIRHNMNDTEGLMLSIKESLKSQKAP